MLQPRVWIRDGEAMYLVDMIEFGFDVTPICYVEELEGTREDTGCELYPDEVIFMQNTTLKDANGKYIYEGDILKTTTTDELFVVRYDLNRGWRADADRLGVTLQDLLEGKVGYNDLVDLRLYNYKHLVEVVGNVFENTELYDENSIFEYEKRRLIKGGY